MRYIRSHGFTLVEVLVAFTILGLTLAALFAVLSASSRNMRVAGEYSHAVALAESKMAEIGITESLRPGLQYGDFDAIYRWSLQVEKYPIDKTKMEFYSSWEPVNIRLQVHWLSMEKERDITLNTVRLVSTE